MREKEPEPVCRDRARSSGQISRLLMERLDEMVAVVRARAYTVVAARLNTQDTQQHFECVGSLGKTIPTSGRRCSSLDNSASSECP